MVFALRCAVVNAVVIGASLFVFFPDVSRAQSLSPERERTLKAGDVFKECSNCPEMIVVPAGSFTMGSPENEIGRPSYKDIDDEDPQHEVTISKPFAVGRFLVTVDQFAAFVRATGYDAGSTCEFPTEKSDNFGEGRSWRNPGFTQKGNYPAVCLDWNDAKAYVGWLSRLTGRSYRLLTEAEWEYAARAGSSTPFWWGSSISTSQANYNGNFNYGNGPTGEYRQRTIPVDSFEANPWGLYQMNGNVRQWTEDCWHPNYSGAPGDGSAWTTSDDCDSREVRGGSWFNGPAWLRSAHRDSGCCTTEILRYNTDGIRVARTLSAPVIATTPLQTQQPPDAGPQKTINLSCPCVGRCNSSHELCASRCNGQSAVYTCRIACYNELRSCANSCRDPDGKC